MSPVFSSPLVIFDGSNILAWLLDIENFFAIGHFREEDKLSIVALYVEGRVKKWFASVLRQGGFSNWLDFKLQLVSRFAESRDEAPGVDEQTGDKIHSVESIVDEPAGLEDFPLAKLVSKAEEYSAESVTLGRGSSLLGTQGMNVIEVSSGRGVPIRDALDMSKMIPGMLQGIFTMPMGEITMFQMKPDMQYVEKDCPVSAPGNFPKDDELHFETELLDSFKGEMASDDLRVVNKILNEGEGWESSGEPYDVKFHKDELYFSMFGKSEVPIGLEFPQKEKAVIYVHMRYLTESLLVHIAQYLEEVHFKVKRVHYIPVLDMLGDRRLLTRRIRDSRIESNAQLLEFGSGEGLVPKGCEMCTCLIIPGQTALVTCPPVYAYDGFWDIERLGLETPRDWTGVDFPSIMNEVDDITSPGNMLFTEGKFELTKAKYEKVLQMFSHINPQDEDRKVFGDARNILHLNVTASLLKLGDWRKSVETCNTFFAAQPGQTKCLYRRGMAYTAGGEYKDPRSDTKFQNLKRITTTVGRWSGAVGEMYGKHSKDDSWMLSKECPQRFLSYKLGGGALVGLNARSWALVLAEFVYVFGGGCPFIWKGFSTATFVDLIPMLKLSISLRFMICLEYRYMSSLVLMVGYAKDTNIAISGFSIYQYMYTWDLNICLGFLGVANELGKGDAAAVIFSIPVVPTISPFTGVIFSVLCLTICGQISYMLSTSKRVLKAGDDLSMIIAISILLNIIHPILSGVAAEAGMQSIVAVVNLASYYANELPSQFMENWCYHKNTLLSLAKHYPPALELPTKYVSGGTVAGYYSYKCADVFFTDFVVRFLFYKLEGKLDFVGGSIDRFDQIDVQNKQWEEEEGDLSSKKEEEKQVMAGHIDEEETFKGEV